MKIRITAIYLIGIFLFSSLPSVSKAQDLIARQAPVDHRVKAADSVSLKHLISIERNEEMKGLYPDFNNSSVHHYKGLAVPDSFRIDLRHFCMPTTSTKITSNYGYRPSFRRVHKGIDVKVYIGDTIRSAFSGRVRIVDYESNGYGNYVVIRHGNGLETVYGHLSKQLVSEGQVVRAGEPIGLGGNTGLSTGSHLHFETLFLGKAIDPALLFDFPNQDIVKDFYTFYNTDENNGSGKYASKSDNSTIKDIRYHKVKRGETLESIASDFGTTAEILSNQNNISLKTRLRTGQIIRFAE